MYIYKYLLQSRYNNNVRFFAKLLKTHFFVRQIFRSHFCSFCCLSNFTMLFSNIYSTAPNKIFVKLTKMKKTSC